MNMYETSAVVEEMGRIRVVGVPFEPGTRVAVTVTPVETSAGSGTDEERSAQRLLAALAKARNTESVGPLRRAELYDRDILIDTNILLYAASNAPADQAKRRKTGDG